MSVSPYKPLSFLVVCQHNWPRGVEQRIIKLYDRTPEEQRELLNKAIVGYDPHHPDSPDTSVYKFAVPEKSATPATPK